MTQPAIRAAFVLALAGTVLAGCEAGQGPFAAKPAGEAAAEGEAPTARAATSTRLVDRDVEAPDVFQTTDQSLWDGRPSLGGVWVASPEAKDPERVIIRNTANGKFVIGALFRRERMNPGPTLQISSDAAAALGILAGAPTEVQVTALRREEVPDADSAAAPGAPILDAAETVETETLGAAAVAAIDRTEEGTPIPAAAAAGDIATATLAAPGTAVAPEPPAKKKKKRGKKAAEEPLPVAAAPGDAIAAAPLAAAPLTAVPVAAVAEAPAAAPAPKGGQLIQIGIFSVEANARRAVDALAKAGVTARILTETAKGKTFWRVVAGPGADTAMLGKVKSAGFGDAYFVKG